MMPQRRWHDDDGVGGRREACGELEIGSRGLGRRMPRGIEPGLTVRGNPSHARTKRKGNDLSGALAPAHGKPAVLTVFGPRALRALMESLVAGEVRFGACRRRSPRGYIGSKGGVGKVSARRVFRPLQTGTGPRRSPSACAEILQKTSAPALCAFMENLVAGEVRFSRLDDTLAVPS